MQVGIDESQLIEICYFWEKGPEFLIFPDARSYVPSRCVRRFFVPFQRLNVVDEAVRILIAVEFDRNYRFSQGERKPGFLVRPV